MRVRMRMLIPAYVRACLRELRLELRVQHARHEAHELDLLPRHAAKGGAGGGAAATARRGRWVELRAQRSDEVGVQQLQAQAEQLRGRLLAEALEVILLQLHLCMRAGWACESACAQ